MDLLTREDLAQWVEPPDSWALSIYMPTYRLGREREQNPTRFKNMLGQAEEQLLARGLRSRQVQDLLEPTEALVQDDLFWQHQSDGLAFFLSQEAMDYYRLPFSFEEMVVVGDYFYTKPLLPLLSVDGRFYILALSQDEIRLLQGTRQHVQGVDLEGVPKSLAEALRLDDPEQRIQWHTGTTDVRGDRAAQFHGHGVGGTDEAQEKVNIERFLQRVDEGLQDLLAEERSPLVLAGVDYLLTIFQEVSSYDDLLEEQITGNPEQWSEEMLHRQAWDLVQPKFQREQEEALSLYRHFAHTDRTSGEIGAVVRAARYGQVDTLFVALDEQRWGQFDPASQTVELHEERELGDADLLDLAALHTIWNQGEVYALARAEMPAEVPLAAILRYEKIPLG